MYLVNSFVLIVLAVLGSYTIYKFLLDKTYLSRNTITMIFLYILEAIFILISHNYIFYLFLDISAFIAYLISKRKESLILFLLTTLYSQTVINISPYYSFIYLIAITLLVLLPSNKKYYYLLFIKIFINSYLYFLYVDYSSLSILLLVATFLLFDLLVKLTVNFLKIQSDPTKEENIMFQVAHEVKNPICVCKGYLDMLDTSDKEKIEKYIPIVKKEMNRALNVMDSFLDLKRLTINRDLMDLSILLQDVKETLLLSYTNKKVKLLVPKIDDEIIINADYDKLKQVLINIIKNSYEASAKAIKISIRKSNSLIKIKISDDGKGISNTDLNKIGTPFYTNKANGSGIGVALSKEIIKRHDGKLVYTSKVNEGTDATIILPLEYCF